MQLVQSRTQSLPSGPPFLTSGAASTGTGGGTSHVTVSPARMPWPALLACRPFTATWPSLMRCCSRARLVSCMLADRKASRRFWLPSGTLKVCSASCRAHRRQRLASLPFTATQVSHMLC